MCERNRYVNDHGITVKDKNGVVISYGYVSKDLGVELYTDVDKDGKVTRVEIDLRLN
jgi:hypothetical protein